MGTCASSQPPSAKSNSNNRPSAAPATITSSVHNAPVHVNASTVNRRQDDTVAPAPATSGDSLNWKALLDAVEKDVDLWNGIPRQDRPVWKDWLDKAGKARRKPKKPLSKASLNTVLEGNMEAVDKDCIVSKRNEVIAFVSSTFTDTKAERNILMKDVYPYLRLLCRSLGLEFGTVDMRWGVTDDTAKEHETVNMCLRQIDRCLSTSAGPAFLCILGDKYGWRPIPSEIDQVEFEKMLNVLIEDEKSLLSQYFQLDLNGLSPKYVLRPKEEKDIDWNTNYQQMQKVLQMAAKKTLSEEEYEKYFISVTEMEVHRGILHNERRNDQVTLIYRDLAEVTSSYHLHRHLVDMEGTQSDTSAADALRKLKEEKLAGKLPDGNLYKQRYDAANLPAVKEYIRTICDEICQRLASSILENYERHLHVKTDPTSEEVLHHINVARNETSTFAGRNGLLKAISDYVESTNEHPLVVYGNSGIGKTALLAMAAKMASSASSQPAVVTRFIGTSSMSTLARPLLYNVCRQITRFYKRDVNGIPRSYTALIKYFRKSFKYAKNKPLVIFFDGLDQIANANSARDLKWLSLSEPLPAHVRLILSAAPGQILNVLKNHVPESNLLQVTSLKEDEAYEILSKILSTAGRKLTNEQRDLVMNAAGHCRSPMHLRLTADLAVKWRSYTNVSAADIAQDIFGAINILFDRIEKRHGQVLTRHALAYITASRSGLSATELEDMLSCDDEVLNDVYKYWVPPVRHIPPLLWIRIRNDLDNYLVEIGSDDVHTYVWYHRHFRLAAQKRYLNDTAFTASIRLAIVDYFDDKWVSGKPYSAKDGKSYVLEDRWISAQPYCLFGDRTTERSMNKRKLYELPYHLIELREWKRYIDVCCQLEYVEAKFEAQQGQSCALEFQQAAKQSADDVITSWYDFITASTGRLMEQPIAIYQLAAQQPPSSPVRKHLFSINLPSCVTLMIDPNQTDALLDPCLTTLLGHKEEVVSCCYSSDGRLIASTDRYKNTVRVWDALTATTITCGQGEELDTSVCGFSLDNRHLAAGSKTGCLVLWELSNANIVQVWKKKVHDGRISNLIYFRDGKRLVLSSEDGSVSFFSVPEYQLQEKVSLTDGVMCCDLSCDSRQLCALLKTTTTDLVIVSADSYQVVARGQNKERYVSPFYHYCCSFTPDGRLIVTSVDEDIVVRESVNCQPVHRMTAKGSVFCIAVMFDDSRFITTSFNGIMSVWSFSSEACVSKYRAHTEQINALAFNPMNKNNLLTASDDKSLKIWDLEVLLSGKVAYINKKNCIYARFSPDRKYIVEYIDDDEYEDDDDSDEDDSDREGDYELRLVETGKRVGKFFHSEVPPAFTWDSTRLITSQDFHNSDDDCDFTQLFVRDLSSAEVLLSVNIPSCFSLASSRNYILCAGFDSETDEGVCFILDDKKCELVKMVGIPGRRGYISGSSASDEIAIATLSQIEVINLGDPTTADVETVAGLVTDKHLSDVIYSPDGRHLVGITMGGAIYVWRTPANFKAGRDHDGDYRLVKCFDNRKASVADASFSANSRFLMTLYAEDQALAVWDLIELRLKSQWFGSSHCVYFESDNTLVVIDANRYKRHLTFDLVNERDLCDCMITSPDGCQQVGITKDGVIYVWQAPSDVTLDSSMKSSGYKLVACFDEGKEMRGAVKEASISPNSRYLLVFYVGRFASAAVWDLSEFQLKWQRWGSIERIYFDSESVLTLIDDSGEKKTYSQAVQEPKTKFEAKAEAEAEAEGETEAEFARGEDDSDSLMSFGSDDSMGNCTIVVTKVVRNGQPVDLDTLKSLQDD